MRMGANMPSDDSMHEAPEQGSKVACMASLELPFRYLTLPIVSPLCVAELVYSSTTSYRQGLSPASHTCGASSHLRSDWSASLERSGLQPSPSPGRAG
jgi:hypothetical protein